MQRIELEQKTASMRRRFLIVTTAFLGSLSFGVPMWRIFQNDLVRSGFTGYVSLPFYDLRTVLTNWQDFTLGVLESFPIVSTIGLLALTFVFLLTLKFAVRYGKDAFTHTAAH